MSSSSGDSSSAYHAQINCVLALMMIVSEHVKLLFTSAECLMMNRADYWLHASGVGFEAAGDTCS